MNNIKSLVCSRISYAVYGILSFCCMLLLPLKVTADWKPVEGRIMTQWAADVDPENPLPEYPRPQLVRENWMNLNGLWDYKITPKSGLQPTTFDGKILVPFLLNLHFPE